jgi:hypothetical protein
LGAKDVDGYLGFGACLGVPGRQQVLERLSQRLGSYVREGAPLVVVDE